MLERVGRYRVEEKIGEGAMADVYRAYDPSIHRTLAIKVLKPEYSQIREYAVRFLREAKAAGALNHPNIVTVYDVGEVEGHPYIAMELVDGLPMNELVSAKGVLSPGDVTAIGLELADALSYAHKVGVVHRDIKPSNIMVLKDGRTIRILDFGIARMAEAADALFKEESLKTQIGQVLGSPRYMSPEQALGREIDGRSDLFSVGVVLYELLSGKKAFSGASAATLALQITTQDPPTLAEVAPASPRGLQFIITKLMAKQADRRFQDGAQLADALRREQAAAAAQLSDAEGRRQFLPLPIRAALMVMTITAVVLALAIGAVLNRQNAGMQRMALTSGGAVASFVSNNVAFQLISNASAPSDQRDWQPIQGFVENASKDPNVLSLAVVDADGVVRGARDPAAVGKPDAPPAGEKALSRTPDGEVTVTGDGEGLRFKRVIAYGGRPVGRLDMVLSRADLQGASRLSALLMMTLAAVVLGSVGAASYIVARSLSGPIRRLKAALRDAAAGNLSFRLSHQRKDEFGELFDAFNTMSANLEDRVATAHLALDAAPVRPAPQPAPPPTDGPFARPMAPAPTSASPSSLLPTEPSAELLAAAPPRAAAEPAKRAPRPKPPAPDPTLAPPPTSAPPPPGPAADAGTSDADRTVIRPRPKHAADS